MLSAALLRTASFETGCQPLTSAVLVLPMRRIPQLLIWIGTAGQSEHHHHLLFRNAPLSLSCHRGAKLAGRFVATRRRLQPSRARFLFCFLDDALVFVLTFAVIIFDPSNWHLRGQPACLCPPLRTHPSSAPWPGIYSGRGGGALASPLHPSSISFSFFCLPDSLIK